jgi:hypothetical protein
MTFLSILKQKTEYKNLIFYGFASGLCDGACIKERSSGYGETRACVR